MNEEIKREEVISYLSQRVWLESNDTIAKMLSKAIDFIQQVPKYRKKAKRWKRKYMSLLSEVERIRAEIAEDLANAGKEAKQTKDDVDCGITIGLQMALDAVSKHMKKPLIIEPQERSDKE